MTLEMSTGHSARQVFDLPEPAPLIVIEHRAHDCQCPGCGAHTRAGFPDGVNAPVQYGPRIAAFVIYLLHYQLLPEDRLAELMADLWTTRLLARHAREHGPAEGHGCLAKLVQGTVCKILNGQLFMCGPLSVEYMTKVLSAMPRSSNALRTVPTFLS